MPSTIRVFILDSRVVNTDNDEDAAMWLKRGARELSADEVTATFGEQAHLAGPHNSVVHADGSISFTPPAPRTEELAALGRAERDRLMREVYDPAMMQLLRRHRTAVTAGADTAEINASIAAWDAYAIALEGVPEQAGFPNEIVWPQAPAANAEPTA
ncbi:phage tail assembly chaperone [Desulfovibrio subterraneus]|uniref:Phage tail assembly chaperone-like domain-containing protein n=1 Tax=Desulfovibrio subterraneus TaxID=2718620 RepID=A0A7J0BJL7_9BACT|nr:phage tail assembly chaperone [Desulfovibrio subterraneus]GFM33274.1 hypothetical protein DSM101010T_16390 [Desulfovibrio subterraneus]